MCAAVIVTSDKCYENVEWAWGYKETTTLEGRTSTAHLRVRLKSFFMDFLLLFLRRAMFDSATARAGNVIGGGDWSTDRIVVDCVRNWAGNSCVKIRSPSATRPWQHVLEPLSGYLILGADLYQRADMHGESFNFGPKAETPITVEKLIQDLGATWAESTFSCSYEVVDRVPFNEAGLLKLNCDKALFHLGWQATLTYKECIEFVGSWYLKYYSGEEKMRDLTVRQIKAFENRGSLQGMPWSH